MKFARISQKQTECLLAAIANGGELFSWPGGWWSPQKYVPELDCFKRTPPASSFHELHVLNLIRHRLFEVTERQGRNSQPCTVRVTQEALDLPR